MSVAERFSSAVSYFDDGLVKASKFVGVDISDEGKTENEVKALRIVRRYTTLSVAGGLIPLPLVDLIAVSAAQIKMLQEITALYGVEFSKERTKILVTGLLGSVIPEGLAQGVAGSALKSIPGVGSAVGFVLMPSLSGAITFALGKVFIQHFEAGGTLFDLNPNKLKEHFKQLVDTHEKPADV